MLYFTHRKYKGICPGPIIHSIDDVQFFLAFKACFPGSNLGRLCKESVAITSTAVLSGVELALLASILNLLIFILI